MRNTILLSLLLGLTWLTALIPTSSFQQYYCYAECQHWSLHPGLQRGGQQAGQGGGE